VSDDVTLYHGTTTANLATILRDGLEPGHGGGCDDPQMAYEVSFRREFEARPKSVFLTKDFDREHLFAAMACHLHDF
jgi:hypothetical protein